MHQVRVHNKASPYAQRIDTPWCPCCLAYMHTVRRVVRHVAQGAKACRERCVEYLPPVVDNPYEQYEINREPRKSNRAPPASQPDQRAAVRMPGPLPRWAV
eukprot:657382-Alexandrium_andersonii.AAC.1